MWRRLPRLPSMPAIPRIPSPIKPQVLQTSLLILPVSIISSAPWAPTVAWVRSWPSTSLLPELRLSSSSETLWVGLFLRAVPLLTRTGLRTRPSWWETVWVSWRKNLTWKLDNPSNAVAIKKFLRLTYSLFVCFAEFNFTTGAHDVAEVTKAAFTACNGTNPISHETEGPADIDLETAGEHYFICTVGSHCSLGQKLAINVTTNSSTSPTTPPSSSTTPTSPSPSGGPSQSPSGSTTPPSPGSAPSFSVAGLSATLLSVAAALLY